MSRIERYILAASVLVLVLSSCGRGKTEGQEQAQQPEPVPPIGFYFNRYVADTSRVRSGDTFPGLLGRLGAEAPSKIAAACPDSIFNPRKLIADKKVVAYYSADSLRSLEYVEYVNSRTRSTIFKCRDSLAFWIYDKPVEHQRRSVDVTINSSLWSDMMKSCVGFAPDALAGFIMNLADIYQWSVNFFALQQGDRFRVLYDQSVCEGTVVAVDSVQLSIFTPSGSGREVSALRFKTADGTGYWGTGGESLKRMFLKAPLKYNRISSRFTYHRKHPVTGKVKAHTAVDYAAPTGTPVHAIGDGTISKCGWDPTGGGNRIKITHAQGYESSYMHLSKFASGIRQGTRVSQGQLIGYVGSTGTSTGPHLDFRIWQNGKPIDPLTLNSPATEPLAKRYMAAFDTLYTCRAAELDSLCRRGN